MGSEQESLQESLDRIQRESGGLAPVRDETVPTTSVSSRSVPAELADLPRLEDVLSVPSSAASPFVIGAALGVLFVNAAEQTEDWVWVLVWVALLGICLGAFWLWGRQWCYYCATDGIHFRKWSRHERTIPWADIVDVRLGSHMHSPVGRNVTHYFGPEIRTVDGDLFHPFDGTTSEGPGQQAVDTINAWRYFYNPASRPPREAPAAWYPNPTGSGRRYWNGTAWTNHFAP